MLPGGLCYSWPNKPVVLTSSNWTVASPFCHKEISVDKGLQMCGCLLTPQIGVQRAHWSGCLHGWKERLWGDQTAKAILGEEERAERRAKMSEKQILYDGQQSGRLWADIGCWNDEELGRELETLSQGSWALAISVYVCVSFCLWQWCYGVIATSCWTESWTPWEPRKAAMLLKGGERELWQASNDRTPEDISLKHHV